MSGKALFIIWFGNIAQNVSLLHKIFQKSNRGELPRCVVALFLSQKRGKLQMKIINKSRFITALVLALLLLVTVFAQLQLILLERMGG